MYVYKRKILCNNIVEEGSSSRRRRFSRRANETKKERRPDLSLPALSASLCLSPLARAFICLRARFSFSFFFPFFYFLIFSFLVFGFARFLRQHTIIDVLLGQPAALAFPPESSPWGRAGGRVGVRVYVSVSVWVLGAVWCGRSVRTFGSSSGTEREERAHTRV